MRRKRKISRESAAEWRGAVKEALTHVSTRISSIDVVVSKIDERLRKQETSMEVVNKEMGQVRDELKGIRTALGNLSSSVNQASGGMSGRDRAILYGSALTAVSGIIIALITAIA